MELVQHAIPWRPSDHRPIVIAPLGDIQWLGGKSNHVAKDLLKRHIDRCMELDAWFIGTGDYIDTFSPSNRQRIKAAALYETAEEVMDGKILELVHELFDDYLRPTKDRWLGMVHGHHWYQFRAGDTSDTRLCEMLGAKFLGTCAYVRLVFHARGKLHERGTECYPITIFVHHGTGGGGKVHGPLLKLENFAPYWDADIFIMGHATKVCAAPITRVVARWAGPGAPDLVERKIHLVGAGGFFKGYAQGAKQGNVPMGSYVEQKMLAPVSLGAPIIRIAPHIRWTTRERRRHRAWSPDVSVEV